MGARAARVLGFAVVGLIVVTLLSDVVYDGFIKVADQVFSVRNDITPEGVEQPTSPLRSSGEGSEVTWESLGREGRKFVGTGPTAEPARRSRMSRRRNRSGPMRASSGTDVEARARLAVDDLDRAGGFERRRLMVATTTGAGWSDPASVDTFEYLDRWRHRDRRHAVLLPSLVALVPGRPTRAREAGRELFDAVYERWSACRPTSGRS